jgi:putative ABC transport system permease protein
MRYGFRTLWQRPGFTVVAVLTLALGIGANTAIFSVVNGVLLRSLPFREPDSLVMLWEADAKGRDVHLSHLNLVDWRDQSQSFESFSAYSGRWGGKDTILGGNEPERAFAVAVYRDFFKVLGVAPAVGRTFSTEEHNAGTTPVAIVSYGFWQRRLGGDTDLSSKRLTLGDTSFQVVGVMPSGFQFPSETDVWLSKEQLGSDPSERSAHNYVGIARLKPGVTREQAQGELSAIALRLAEQYPVDNLGMGAHVLSLEDQLVGSVRPALLVLLAAVGFVLLIACANVSNLLLARALGRQKEIAIRTALGASPWRIVRQLLTESLLLACLGGALGLLLAYWLIGPLVALSPASIPRLDEISIDGRTLAFTVGVSLLTSMIFGLLPAVRFSRPDLQVALKQGGQNASSGSGLLRSALVVAEVALTLVLLIGAGLLAKSFWRLLQINPGFNPEPVLTMQLALPETEFREEQQRVAFYRQFFARAAAVPGVLAVGMINNLPLGGVNINGGFQVEGRPEDQGGYAGFRIISPGYYRALGIPVVKGRAFTEQDNEHALPVAIISERVANTTWPGEDPIGKRIRSSMDATSRTDPLAATWMTIVGVAGDVRHSGLEGKASAELYVPYMQRPRRAGEMTVVLRTTGDPSSISAAVRDEVKAINRNLPVEFEPMGQVFKRSVASRRYNMLLLGVFAALALLLSVLGLYGVLSYTVSQSTREIGIRMALGAQPRDVLGMIVKQGMTLTVSGIFIGILAALGLTRLMTSLLYGVTATDPWTFAGVSALLIAVAILACFVPARRATKVDPMIALRYE